MTQNYFYDVYIIYLVYTYIVVLTYAAVNAMFSDESFRNSARKETIARLTNIMQIFKHRFRRVDREMFAEHLKRFQRFRAHKLHL